jgi:hypothetical protein
VGSAPRTASGTVHLYPIYPSYESNKPMKTRLILLCATVALLAASAASAQPRPRVTVSGVITDVDFSRFPETLTLTRDGRSLELNLHRHTRILTPSGMGSFADLREGLAAVAQVDMPTRNIFAIRVAADPDVEQVVGRVEDTRLTNLPFDPTTGEIDLDTANDGLVDLSLTTDVRTELRLGQVHLAPEQLHLLEGFVVVVEFDPDTLHAYRVVGRIPAGTLQLVEARVLDVDHDDWHLVLGPPASPLELEVADGAVVGMGAHRAAWPFVMEGDDVRVIYLPVPGGPNIALGVAVQGVQPRMVTGTVRAVDLVNERVRIQTARGATGWVVILPTADLRINGRFATLEQLAEALATEAPVRIAAQHFVRGDTRIAIRVRANSRAGGPN